MLWTIEPFLTDWQPEPPHLCGQALRDLMVIGPELRKIILDLLRQIVEIVRVSTLETVESPVFILCCIGTKDHARQSVDIHPGLSYGTADILKGCAYFRR